MLINHLGEVNNMVKVCCGNGKPYETLTAIEKLACNNDHCRGPILLEDYDLLLTGLGTFCTKECVSSVDLCKLLKPTIISGDIK